MKKEGFEILWTPPYCPPLQPIEEFWGSGKNHVADCFDNKTTMKDVVRRLRAGWYGNEDSVSPENDEYHTGTSCNGLVLRSIDAMDKRYIPLCPGLSGKIGALEIDYTHQPDKKNIPIDCLVVDLAKDFVLDEE